MRKKLKTKNLTLENYTHDESKRVNNPPVGLVSTATDRTSGKTKYAHDPHIDPQLSWAGKVEGTSFEVPNVSLHIHERIDPQRIAKSFLKKRNQPMQQSLFEDPYNDLPLLKAIDFYKHEQEWSNRLIAGDSLLVMNSLIQKEGMAGKVQMIYIDPPYGIKYNSNFQPFLNKRDVKDNNDADIPAEPEMIEAFRDTWELGIHSYLTHLYHRLLQARELLYESGSVFIQISNENLHHVKELCDEIFGSTNFCAVIPFRKKTMPLGATLLESMHDYLIWYAKDIKKVKYRHLYEKQNIQGDIHWCWIELSDGSRRKMTKSEIQNHSLLPSGAKIFRLVSLWPPEYRERDDYPIEFRGRIFKPPKGFCWLIKKEGMESLIKANRIEPEGEETLRYVYFLKDWDLKKITGLWDDTVGARNKLYVVQTAENVVERCLLMTTDPGDLVLDPTCGSGTSAYASEKWGRRWITCDTSRVAIALTKQRLMTAKFQYYKLAHPDEGINSGFEYKKAPRITLGSNANDEPPHEEILYDQPVVETNKIRVTGPFTVEAVPSLRIKPFDGSEIKITAEGTEAARTGETNALHQWIDELKVTGIRATGGKIIQFNQIAPLATTRYLHAEAEIISGAASASTPSGGVNVNVVTQKAVISFGPDYGPLEQRQVEEAIQEAKKLKDKPEFIIFAAFHFDPEAAKDIDQINNSKADFKILKAQMTVDLLTSDLRKKRSSNQSYWLIGQPDIELIKNKDETYQVNVNGFDYYNPVTGEIESGSEKQIAMWMLDTDYDEQSILPEQVFFPVEDAKRDWTKLAKALNGTVEEELLEMFTGTKSLPFKAGENKKIAVKIIDNRGIESFVVKEL